MITFGWMVQNGILLMKISKKLNNRNMILIGAIKIRMQMTLGINGKRVRHYAKQCDSIH